MTFLPDVPLCSWILRRSVFNRHRLVGVALATAGSFWAAAAAAQVAPAETASSATCGEALRGQAQRARTWRYVWSGINAGVTVASFVPVPLVKREDRPDWIVSGVGSGVTLLATWFFPLRVESASDELEAMTPQECRAQLPRLLLESRQDSQARVTWPWHVLNIGLSAAAGSIIAFGYQHYTSGLVTTVASATLGEVQLFTQPVIPSVQQSQPHPVPRLAFTPASGGLPAVWTLSVASAF